MLNAMENWLYFIYKLHYSCAAHCGQALWRAVHHHGALCRGGFGETYLQVRPDQGQLQ